MLKSLNIYEVKYVFYHINYFLIFDWYFYNLTKIKTAYFQYYKGELK
jgi:hypothetical protein